MSEQRPKYMITNIRDANRDGLTVQILFPDNNKRTLKLSANRLAELADPTHEFEGFKAKRRSDITQSFEVAKFGDTEEFVIVHQNTVVKVLAEDRSLMHSLFNYENYTKTKTLELGYMWERGKKIPPPTDQVEEGEKS